MPARDEFETAPPCAKSPDLFGSNDPYDHMEARRICMNECDRVSWCLGELAKARDKSPAAWAPEGTWAGLFCDGIGRRWLGGGPRVLPAGGASKACGTPRGRRYHFSRDEPLCDACKAVAVYAEWQVYNQ